MNHTIDPKTAEFLTCIRTRAALDAPRPRREPAPKQPTVVRDPAALARIRERVRSRRAVLGLSRTQLAKKAGVGPTTVGALEQGKKAVGHGVLAKVAEALGGSLQWLLAE